MLGKIIAIVLCAVAHSAISCPQYDGPYPPFARQNLPYPGKVYRVVLPYTGPEPLPAPPVNAPPVVAPAIEGPLIQLPTGPIPAPQVIAHRCVCTKTVVKPQIVQRVINVPKVTRYLKRTYRPVVENIQYSTVPQAVESYPAPCQQPPFPPCQQPQFPPCNIPFPPLSSIC